jgi:hypothetical protein
MPDDRSGWCYVMVHPAWSSIGLVKIGMTARDPTRRAAEITAVSGLVAPCKVAFCCHVADRRAVENAVKAALGGRRVRGRRELFRCDVAAARAAIESAACHTRAVPVPRRAPWRPRRAPRQVRRRRILIRLALVLAAALALVWLRG